MKNKSQSPQTGQFNSYSMFLGLILTIIKDMSQSPQTGQFNSYTKISRIFYIVGIAGLNPLKRVNSILTMLEIL